MTGPSKIMSRRTSWHRCIKAALPIDDGGISAKQKNYHIDGFQNFGSLIALWWANLGGVFPTNLSSAIAPHRAQKPNDSTKDSRHTDGCGHTGFRSLLVTRPTTGGGGAKYGSIDPPRHPACCNALSISDRTWVT